MKSPRRIDTGNRPLTSAETECLRDACEVPPGEPIILFVCQDAWREDPTGRVFRLMVPAPIAWDAAAILDIVARVFEAAGEPEHTALGTRQATRWQSYCRFKIGRFIRRATGQELDVDPGIHFLEFGTARTWYHVALPTLPTDAIAQFLSNPALSATIDFTLSPAVVDEWLPHPRVASTQRRPRRPRRPAPRRAARAKAGAR